MADRKGRQDRFVGGEEDVTLGRPPPSRGYVVDVDGDGETTATVRGGAWVSGEPSLVSLLQVRQDQTGLTDDQSLASDAVHLLELPDDAMKAL